MTLYADLSGGFADDGLRVSRWRLAGGWCWKRVTRRPRYDGHDSYPVTLTGLGERVYLASPEVDLDNHIKQTSLISSSSKISTKSCSSGTATRASWLRARRIGSPRAALS
jgi:hypothetical protein